jgi:hypothetical protein
MIAGPTLVSMLLCLFMAHGVSGQAPEAPSPADVDVAINLLGSLDDYSIRMNAARTVRRADPAVAVAALERAARSHEDEYVRYRALVLLTGFGPSLTTGVMRELMDDRNDRLRTVVFGWFERHPDAGVVPMLVDALARERSEFVRPALTRALAAQGDDPRARDVLLPLVLRGEDFFRGAVIEALGDYRVAAALPNIVAVAALEGPLQDDAISAIGKIGDSSLRQTLASLQRTVPRELQPTVSASLCLLGVECETQEAFVDETLAFAAETEGFQALLRGAVHAEAMLAASGRAGALRALLDQGVVAGAGARAPIALGVGLVAFRTPDLVLRVLGARTDLEASVALFRDAFDMLNEDLEEERFFVEVRRAYWAAADGSSARRVAEMLITMLEF